LRLSGEPAQTPFLQRVCAPNEPDVVLPTQNLAITGALTAEALLATPEHQDSIYARLYRRVLPPGLSQVTAMLAQQPTLVSVELGANEIFGASDGAYVPGQTVVPVSVWAPQYRQVLDNVQRATSRALLVGLPTRALDFPGLRLGDELWAARATFVPFNVAVSSDCRGSANALLVPVIVTTAVRTGVFNALHHLGRYRLSCKDSPALAPNGSVIRDFVLSPTDLALVDRQLTEMDQLIRTEAVQRGFAYYTLGALYDDVNHKARFNAITLVTAQAPYGPYFSLDGVHPSARGAQVLAEAAARALDERYEAGIGPRATLTAARSTESSVPPISDR
jgi:lysophospholipase L1-like esterase